MMRSRNSLYLILSTACFSGYLWLFWVLWFGHASAEVCIIKHVTDIPCPSCGTTRSVMALLQGDFMMAASLNPLGFIIIIIMIVVPTGLIIDCLWGKSYLFFAYQKSEHLLKKPYVAVPVIAGMLINWIWNIMKAI